MKPNWLDAPDWASYMAEGDLGWYWFELKPNWLPWEGRWDSRVGKYSLVSRDVGAYEHSLERRP